MSAATRRKLSARERGRHHKGHKLTAAERRKLSARLRGRHHRHPAHHRGHKMTAAQRKRLSARLRGRHHPHRGHKGKRHVLRQRLLRHRALSHHAPVRARTRAAGPVRQPRTRRGRIYPSHFGHRHGRLHSRFNHHKRVRSLRAPFVAGRRHVRAWK